jgi:NAD(P)H dehydrogenase (quinone)
MGTLGNSGMKRVLVVFAHPCEESLSSALHQRTLAGLRKGGWEIDDCDLNAEGFNPVLTAQERRDYHDTALNCGPVQSYVDRLRAAEALVLVFPVWNFGFPAILKGWFDRVWLPGVSFDLVDDNLVPALQNIAAVTTYGGDRMRAFLVGDPPRKLVTRVLWGVTRGRVEYHALYGMNKATRPQHEAFLDRVGAAMERF